MRQAIIFVLVLSAGALGWFAFGKGMTGGAKSAEMSAPTAGGSGGPGKPSSGPPSAVSVAIAQVHQRAIPIYLEGLGTVQAFQSVTVRSQIEGVIEKIDFIEGQDVKAGQRLALIDARTHQAQLDQAIAKKKQDEAKTIQDRARVLQDQARKSQDEALEMQAQAKTAQDEALGNQAKSKKKQDETNLANARVNLKRFEDSRKDNAVSEQIVTDQRSLVSQLESQVQSDESAIQAIAASVNGDELAITAIRAAVRGDAAAIQASEALVQGDEAAVLADEAAIQYAKTFVDYATIKSPIDGRTGVRQIDAGNLVRINDTSGPGIVVVTQLQPISVVFTLPQQNLQAINLRRAAAKLTVLAVDSDKNVLDTGELLLVDNQIDTTTGTIKLKATFPNAKMKLWPGGFVNIRLLLETREDALIVASPAIQQGPNGTFVFLIKPDSTVDMRSVKVELVQDGRAILQEGLAKDDEVVLSGHDKIKNGSKVSIDRSKADKGVKDTIKHDTVPATTSTPKSDAPATQGAVK
ncbi:MAG: efflux RND transporter periplasmic adaptor subunit [Planctomycetota bacterium]